MAKQYVTKAYRQRTSMVTSIPIEVRIRLGLSMGDYIVWQADEDSDFAQLSKVVAGGNRNGGDKRNSDRKDKGG